jgi:thiamine biosynthesis lipoprotein
MTARRDQVRSVRQASFSAFTSTIELIGVDVSAREMDAARAYGLELAELWNATFSRFRPDSEISRLNARAGADTRVSEDLYWLLACAKDAWASTGGRFDPTVLPALEAAGYDRDIDLVQGGVAGDAAPMPAPGMRDVMLDPEEVTVRLPAGVRIDLGGIAKGAFVDRLATALMTWPGGCVNAGGDLRVWGLPPSGPHWLVGIEDPRALGTDRLQVEILDARAGCVATSTSVKRRWRTANGTAHHLIDPATGAPARSSLLSCSVLASTTVQAEIGTKALFMAAAHGVSLRFSDCAAAVLLDRTGGVELIPGGSGDACAFPAATADRQSA